MTIEVSGFPWRRVVAVAVGFAVIDELLIVPLFESLFGLTPLEAPLVQRMGWGLTGAFIVAWALAFVAGRARANVEQLSVAFFVILAGLQLAARAQAAYFFQPDVDAETFTGIVLRLVCASAVLAVAAALMFRRGTNDTLLDRPTGFQFTDIGWLWRIPASAAIYFVLFFAAGLIIWPFVQGFYSAQQERLGLLLFEWEYLNGIWFALIALPLLRLIPGDWLRAGVTLGVALCLIRGISGLIEPSPNLPTPIRLWHMFEVGWSNFVYGLAIAYVFLPHPRKAEAR